MITYDISVLIGKDNPNKDVYVKQNDNGVNFRIHLKTAKRFSTWRSEEKDYAIPKKSTCVLKIAKPDKTCVLVDGEASTSSVFFSIPDDSTAFVAAGISEAEVSIYNEHGRRITTATFNIEVDIECVSDCEQDSGSYVDILSDTIKTIHEAEERAEEAADNAGEAADRAEAAAVKTPKISNRDTWMTWDFEKGEYVDTGINATGEDGADGVDGKDGKDGVDGKDGYTPQKGVDYDTEADKAEMVSAVIAALPDGDEVSY